ncbi:hypothetical protein N656DRAFT_555598 [Canariomyces notabilis]|uniref:Uncharacterized protein n=1 Tax=Canariomyces notabilis TaxID=2074819 RepID=A0AAN6TI66_9PEZI|nr:hypothetical protein N656DRAFT_555598 [Canariomyces arenarius]
MYKYIHTYINFGQSCHRSLLPLTQGIVTHLTFDLYDLDGWVAIVAITTLSRIVTYALHAYLEPSEEQPGSKIERMALADLPDESNTGISNGTARRTRASSVFAFFSPLHIGSHQRGEEKVVCSSPQGRAPAFDSTASR